VPLAYTHLLEMMVVMYVLMAPIGLVPRLLWMAVPGCFVTTLIFYGFMCVGPSSPSPYPPHLRLPLIS
jgi:predicted membrane chloride channel (bestrophin family)